MRRLPLPQGIGTAGSVGENRKLSAPRCRRALVTNPGFFIVGAPKCGTTALAAYLGEHPGIFVTKPKEPYFFCTDMPRYRWVRTWDLYRSLFAAAGSDLLAGEASVYYLYSREAIAGIRAAYPRAKLIAILRRPDEMVYSLYRQLRFNREEDQADFRRAWELEFDRREGRNLPVGCRDGKVFHYRSVARYGEQLLRALRHFPREQIEIAFYDDFVRDPRSVYRQLLAFLQLPDDGRDRFPPVNVHKTHRSPSVQSGLRWSFDRLHRLRLAVQERSGIDLSKVWLHRPVTNFLAVMNKKPQKKPPLEDSLRREIVEAYRGDIALLAEISGRNLDDWLR